MPTDDLVAALRAADAVKYGEFELSHGGTSEYYVDKYRFETDPDCLAAIAEAFAERLDGRETTESSSAAHQDAPRSEEADTKLAGVALGGVPLAAATATEAGVPYVIARKQAKEYGTANRIEGQLDDGEEVVVVEDIVTTGQSAVDAVEALRDAGATVNRALIVVDREEGGRELLAEHGVEMDALATASDLLDAE